MEPDRAPAVQRHQCKLARRAPQELRDYAELHPHDDHANRVALSGHVGHDGVSQKQPQSRRMRSGRFGSDEQTFCRIGTTPSCRGANDQVVFERALSVLNDPRTRQAFEVENADPRILARYGRNKFGLSLLMANRLVEAGVNLVQVNLGKNSSWDTHRRNFVNLKNNLLPYMDQAVAAL